MNRLSMAVLALTLSSQAFAYDLYEKATCNPGAKWGTTNTVKVRVLGDSVLDYEASRGVTGLPALTALSKFVTDVNAVIDEYNSVAGSSLRLEYALGYGGDTNLDPYATDDYDNHSIIIGFTSATNGTAPAWCNHHPNDVCTYSESHLYLSKGSNWVYGAPATTDVDGKYFGGGISARAVLLHEIGHGVGLAHPAQGYAVMDHGTKAWTRGTNEVPQMELLPDDLNGLRALYGTGAASAFDLSVTNTWGLGEENYTDDKAAHQEQNCKVSSRGDLYADRLAALVYCGVNANPSSFETVSSDVCQGDDIQLRYTLNNKSSVSLLVKEQVWFSLDEDLEVSGAAMDVQSPDSREWNMTPLDSSSIGRIYKVPNTLAPGTYRVFARALPYDPVTGVSLWSSDVDQWNNSIRVRGTITVKSCP